MNTEMNICVNSSMGVYVNGIIDGTGGGGVRGWKPRTAGEAAADPKRYPEASGSKQETTGSQALVNRTSTFKRPFRSAIHARERHIPRPSSLLSAQLVLPAGTPAHSPSHRTAPRTTKAPLSRGFSL
jgi:hypothetical protein